ncbi:MAG TPA: ExeM/NucH family extracellular endonuclease [Candidatus Limnocylindrales bacterium]|nr:ExeM/NucH family extracellular endonuclease [Candidatus Limnocylindrales bacterium]
MRPVRRARRRLLSVLGSAVIVAGLLPATAVPALAVTTVWINEFHYDNTGTDAGEFVEIAGPAGTDLSTWSIVLYNGATGQTYDTDALAGTIPNQQNGFGTASVAYPANGIQNGSPDAIALVDGATVVQFLSYEGIFAATNGPASGMTSTDIGVSENGSEVLGLSLQLQGTGTSYGNFTWTATPIANTQNSVNTGQTFPATLTLSINDISANEGNSGTTSFDFTVSLSAPAGPGGVTFDIATADGTATVAGSDYVANVLTGQTIAAGGSSYVFSVLVNGDVATEADETFFVNITNVTGADVGDGQGQGTIVNDDQCDLPFTPIYQIQGSGPSAAITGTVTTEGIVVGDFEGSTGLQGFYVQDAGGDGDPATSDGIFVFTGSANTAAAGDLVRVTGFARERFNQTALNGSNSNNSAVPPTNILDCGDGTVPATDVTMPFAALDYPERFEGMLVRLPQALVISEYFNYDRFGETVLALPLEGETRPFTPTSIVEPGAPAQARALANSLRRVTLDDGLSVQNPDVVRHPNGSPFSLSNRFRGGDTVQDTIGVLGFDFSLYRIQPTAPAAYTAVNPRPAAPEEVGGSVRAAALNTLNFFLTLDQPTGNPLDNKCGPAMNVECRGADADQPTEFTRQRDKLLEALAGLDADVVGLNELENTTGVDPLGDPTRGIVPGLNAMLGAGTYAWIDTGTIGTDAIRVGLIYRPAVVQPVGAFQVLDSSDDPRFIDTKSRPVLTQTFEELATGERFTVAVNHLKSKGSDCNDVGDPDIGDGQGNCNQTRTAAAQALVDWLATDPTGSGDPDFLILGDLNSYAQEDPIDAIKAGPDDTAGTADDYTNLIATFLGPYAYSFVFDGQAGYLDHALATPSLLGRVTGAAEWHINADEPDLLDYDTSFKPPAQEAIYEPNAFRSSDHDPVTVGLEPGLCLFSDDPTTMTRTLLGDCSTSETIHVPNGWTLDGDGHTISAYDPEGDHFRGAVVANGGAVAHVTDVTITTYNLADVCDAGADRLRGILFDGASGSITNNRVIDLNQGFSGCQEGNAIEVRNPPFDTTGTDLAVTISGNVATGYQKTGIVANGSVLATILDNEVAGWGPTGVIAQNGIQVGFGGSATIRGNSVSGNFYTGPDVACGILLFQADGVKQQANTLFANERDLCNFGRGGGNVKPNR